MNYDLSSKKLSIIIPLCERTENFFEVYKDYRDYFTQYTDDIEFICVVSDGKAETTACLKEIKASEPDLILIVLNRGYGEATAIQAGANYVSGDLILILPPYRQVETTELYKLFDKIDEFDLVLAKRWPRKDSIANQLQTKIFGYLLRKTSGHDFSDIGCGARLVYAEVLKEMHLYGDQYRFLPLFAYQSGYHSIEVELRQSRDDVNNRIYHPGIYIRRLLDMLTIVFLTKFNKKPLRFFGLIGASSMGLGCVGLLYLAYQRLMLDIAVADRPLLVVFSLFLVLGVQLLGIGLVGETIAFTHANKNREYKIKEIFTHE